MAVLMQDLRAGVYWVSLPRGPERGGAENRTRKYGLLMVLGVAPFLDVQVIWLDVNGAPKRLPGFCIPPNMEGLEIEQRLPSNPPPSVPPYEPCKPGCVHEVTWETSNPAPIPMPDLPEQVTKAVEAFQNSELPPIPPYHMLNFDPSNPQPPGLIAKWMDLAESAWGLIANAGGGDWGKESPEWREAAAKWRDEYFVGIRPLVRKHEKMQASKSESPLAKILRDGKPGIGQAHAVKVSDAAAKITGVQKVVLDPSLPPDAFMLVPAEQPKPQVAAEFDEDGRLTEAEYEEVVRTMQEVVDTNVNPMSPSERQSFMAIFKEKMRAITKPAERFTVNTPPRSDFHGTLFGRTVHLVPDGETGWKPLDPEAFKLSGLEMIGGNTIQVVEGEDRAKRVLVYPKGDRTAVRAGVVDEPYNVKLPLTTKQTDPLGLDQAWRKELRYEDQADGRFVVGVFDETTGSFWQLDAAEHKWMCVGDQLRLGKQSTFARKFEAKAAINTCKKPPFMVQR